MVRPFAAAGPRSMQVEPPASVAGEHSFRKTAIIFHRVTLSVKATLSAGALRIFNYRAGIGDL